MSKQEKDAKKFSVASAIAAGLGTVYAILDQPAQEIATAYQQVLLQNSPLSVQAAVENAIREDRNAERSIQAAERSLESLDRDL